jgi:hypothetical protein
MEVRIEARIKGRNEVRMEVREGLKLKARIRIGKLEQRMIYNLIEISLGMI